MADGGELTLTERFHSALTYASRLHERQKRKGRNVPYVAHLLGVAALVLEAGGDEDQAIAALLHDAVEDQGGVERLEEIRTRFGERVAAIVAGCSDSVTGRNEPKPDWYERKKKYLAHLPTAPADVLLVSAADKLHNARAVLADWREEGDRVFERFRGKKQGTLWYYRALTDTFRAIPDGTPGFRRTVAELSRVVGKIEQKAGKGEDPCRG
jgi:(p)ppGpp synthase/HD superfamily hydrolase